MLKSLNPAAFRDHEPGQAHARYASPSQHSNYAPVSSVQNAMSPPQPAEVLFEPFQWL